MLHSPPPPRKVDRSSTRIERTRAGSPESQASTARRSPGTVLPFELCSDRPLPNRSSSVCPRSRLPIDTGCPRFAGETRILRRSKEADSRSVAEPTSRQTSSDERARYGFPGIRCVNGSARSGDGERKGASRAPAESIVADRRQELTIAQGTTSRTGRSGERGRSTRFDDQRRRSDDASRSARNRSRSRPAATAASASSPAR